MAVKDVEGSRFTKELTGIDLLEWMMDRFNMTRAEAIKNMPDHGHSVDEEEEAIKNILADWSGEGA